MNCHFQQSEDSGILVITGELGVEDAEGLKSLLADALEQASRIDMDLSGAETATLNCLQLLCAAHKAAEQAGKKIELRNAGDEFLRCVRDAGLIRHAGCLDETESVCLWLETAGGGR